MRRSSAFDLRTYFHPHRVFHCPSCAGRTCSTCVKYCAQVECVRPAHIIFMIHLIHSYKYQMSLYFSMNFVKPFPIFIHFKCINQYLINLYRSTCEPFSTISLTICDPNLNPQLKNPIEYQMLRMLSSYLVGGLSFLTE
jgi:hypothetical protein